MTSRRRTRSMLLSLLGALALQAHPGTAAPAPGGDDGGDWPGLFGPHRDARVPGGLPGGPGLQAREVWRRPLGKGYSGISVVGGRGYTLVADGADDFAVAFDAATGKELWRTRLEATYRGHDGSDDGPISTPTVAGGRLFAVTPHGKLVALDAASGRELWRRDLKAELGAADPFYGFATCPLLAGDLLVVQVGGAERNNLMAFDPATGKPAWSSHPARQTGYSSPVLATLGGVPQVIAFATGQVYAVRPADGTLLWSHPVEGEASRSPLVLPGDRVLLSVFEQSVLLQVSAQGGAFAVKELWAKPLFKGTYSPVVHHEGHLYGMNGAYLTCVEPATGEVRWRHKTYNGSLILVGSHLVLLGERSGQLRVVAATPDGFRESVQARVFNPGALSITGPSFAAGRFYLRNLEEMVALELAPAPAAAGGAR